MKRIWEWVRWIALTLTTIAVLAACVRTPFMAPSTPTVMVACTPPPCDLAGGEVYYCSDECPGGCGTQCATPTPAPTRAAAITPTPQPTPTAAPSAAPSATPLPPPPVPFLTATPLPSMAYEAVYNSLSPDRQWIAQGVALSPGTGATYRAQLKLWRMDGTAEWTVVDEASNWGIGWTVPRPFSWSADGRSMYYTDYGVPGGCPGFVNGWGLKRVDLADGSVSEIVPPLGGWMALSPDERQLAYAARGALAVVIRDLTSGEEQEIALQAGQGDGSASIGHILWSPDGSTLVLTVALDRCQALDKLRHSILRLDLATTAETVLLDRDGRWFVTQSWPGPDEVLLLDSQGRHWRLDAKTGQVEQAEELDRALPVSCSVEDPQTSPYVNSMDGYCLRYPAHFVVGDVYSGIANLYGPPLDQSVEPLMAGVSITIQAPAGARTLSQAVDGWFAGQNLPPPEARQIGALGDELAQVVTYQGERSRVRAILALHRDMLYVLSFYPVDERFAAAAPDLELAWETVIRSFAFLSPAPSEAWGESAPNTSAIAPVAVAAPSDRAGLGAQGGNLEQSVPGRFLRVDQAAQMMYVYDGGSLVRELPVSTGVPTSVTLTRTWQGAVGRDLGSGGVDGGMFADFKWFLYQDLYGSVLIHSVPYARQGETRLYDQLDAPGVRPSSHGCVRLLPGDAQWLKDWDPVGAAIEITAWPGPIQQVTRPETAG